MTDENIHLIEDIPNKNITDEEKTKLKNQIKEQYKNMIKLIDSIGNIDKINDILDSDLFAFKLTLEEIKNQSVFIEPFKSHGNSTDKEHLRLLINTNQCIECTKGRKTNLFFNYEPLTKKYYLSK